MLYCNEIAKHLRGFHTNLSELQAQPRSAARKPEDEVFSSRSARGKLRSLRCSLSKTRCAMRYTP